MLKWLQKHIAFISTMSGAATFLYGHLGDKFPVTYSIVAGLAVFVLIQWIWMQHVAIKKLNKMLGNIQIARLTWAMELVKYMALPEVERKAELDKMMLAISKEFQQEQISVSDL